MAPPRIANPKFKRRSVREGVAVGTATVQESRRQKFIDAYFANGQNGTQAALSAGYSPASAHQTAHQMLKKPDIMALVEAQAREVAKKSAMSVQTWARDLSAVAFSSVGDLYRENGSLVPVAELPEHTKRAIASVEITADGTTKVKFWSKTAALETMAKHLGLFEIDNKQKVSDIKVQVMLVG